MKYSAETIERYRESFLRRRAVSITSHESRRRNALEHARALATMLGRDYGATKVVLVGSALDSGRFGESSDIDLVVFTMPKGSYFAAVAACMNPDFDVDLIPFEDAHPMVRRSLEEGMVLYEA